MRVLHTADWHLGQLFHGYDRNFEHQRFLDWLADLVCDQHIDVLLISGDVFDFANPPAASVKMFYRFLRTAVDRCPYLQIVITAGNHDSAHRLEAPKPLLADGKIHIVGVIEKTETGDIDYDKLLIPLYSKTGELKMWCMAVPYLRLGDHPNLKDCDNPYIEGVEELYKRLYKHALTKKEKGQCIIAMGHLHALHCEVSDADSGERAILGGLEGISARAFHDDIKYVALGHIHKAQKVAKQEHIRYCGSPLPMSFSELNYKHQVLVFELAEDLSMLIDSLTIPVAISLKKVPEKPQPLPDVLAQLRRLEDAAGRDRSLAPYLQVQVLMDRPEPGLRHQVEEALEGKFVRLCRVQAVYPSAKKDGDKEKQGGRLSELKPLQIFQTIYESKYNQEPPQELKKLFTEVEAAAYQDDNT